MKDKHIDDFIKSKLSKDRAPASLNNKIEEVLGELPSKDKIHYKKRTPILAASLAFGLFIIMGLSFPTYAGELPVLGSVFKYFQDRGIVPGKMDEYSTKVQTSTMDKGIEITLEEVAADNYGIRFSYEIKSDKVPLDKLEINNSKLFIEGKEYKVQPAEDYSVSQGDNSKYYITIIPHDSLPENFNFSWSISKTAGINGSWNLKGEANKSKIEEISAVVNVDESINSGNYKVNIEKATYSPLQTVITGSIEDKKNNHQNNLKEGFIHQIWVMDERGYKLESRMSASKEDNKPMQFTIKLDNIEKPKLLKLAYGYSHMTETAKEKEFELKELNTLKIYSGNYGSFYISEIKEEEDKFIVKAELEGKYPALLASHLNFKDNQEENKIAHLSKDSLEEIEGNPEKRIYQLVYSKSKEGKYKAFFNNPDEYIFMDLNNIYNIYFK
ncbi:DUF4179 domain-containing protein [Clostridium polynesiense]|uniref:DUF4179 domain-containing protein n=1 Tax=Clostridium polynesiense TaxID=1325933 RepID=UPI00058BB1D0|nr:DUF4179 domain-containing protein [Clostridium polynesiense]